MIVFKTFRFEAAHYLPLVPLDHPCARMHGHSYTVTVECEGSVREDGMVIDFAEISNVVRPLVATLDHQMLNEVIDNPTAENIAQWFADQLNCVLPLRSIRVQETETSGALWLPPARQED